MIIFTSMSIMKIMGTNHDQMSGIINHSVTFCGILIVNTLRCTTFIKGYTRVNIFWGCKNVTIAISDQSKTF